MFTLLRRKLTHLHRDNYCHLCNRNFKNARGLRLHKRVMHSKTTFHALIVLLITVLLGLYSSQIRAYEMISPVSTRPGEGIVATGAVDPTQAPVPSATPTAIPTPTPTTTPEIDAVKAEIHRVFGSRANDAIKIFTCESGLNPKAFNGKNSNGSWDAGIAQVNSIHGVSKTMLFDVETNIAVAKVIYERAGHSFSPWVCANKLGIK